MIWRLMVLPLSQKVVNFTNLGQGLSQNAIFFLIFEPNLQAFFFDKVLAFLDKKSTFILVSCFFDCWIFTILFKYYLKGSFFTEKAS